MVTEVPEADTWCAGVHVCAGVCTPADAVHQGGPACLGEGTAFLFNHKCPLSLATATSWPWHFPYTCVWPLLVLCGVHMGVSISFTVLFEEAEVGLVRLTRLPP